MSSTNRSKSRDNHVADYYVTPPNSVREFLSCFLSQPEFSHLRDEDNPLNFAPGLSFLDPCAGGNSENEIMNESPMTYPLVLSEFGATNIRTMDLREDSKAEFKGNFLEVKTQGLSDIVITNPPFGIAKEIILKALQDAKEGQFIIMLLRLNFFGSKDRREFFRNNMPIFTFVHHKRIGFNHNLKDTKLQKSTDSIEYMHAIWQKGVSQNHSKLILL